jgi:hypothetical protein
MKKIFALTVALAIALVFALTVIGCSQPTSSGGGGGAETWTYVTSFSQVNGSWKPTESSYNFSDNGFSVNVVYTNFIITFNASAKTVAITGSQTATYSGAGIDDNWSYMKTSTSSPYGTFTFNDVSHSMTMTGSGVPVVWTDSQLGIFQINQNGTKLRSGNEVDAVIYTKL